MISKSMRRMQPNRKNHVTVESGGTCSSRSSSCCSRGSRVVVHATSVHVEGIGILFCDACVQAEDFDVAIID
jgi:hypothetical protein